MDIAGPLVFYRFEHFGRHPRCFHELLHLSQAFLLSLEIGPGLIRDQSCAPAVGRQAAVGVVDAQVQAELGARGEHAIRFVRALGDEVINQDRGVGFGAVQNQGRFPLYLQCCVDPSHQALARGLLVAGCAVDLACEEQARDLARLKGTVEFCRIDRVVFDGIAGTQHLGVFESGNRLQDRQLYLDRQRGAHPVHVDFVSVQPFGLEEELVHFLVGELDDLVFDRGAVARADRLDLTAVHRRAVDVLADDAMGLGRGPGDVAGYLRIVMRYPLGAEAEWSGIFVTWLEREARPVNGASVEARRSAGLEAAAAQAELLESFAE